MKVGTRVRYIGGQDEPFTDLRLLLVIGRTGVIVDRSTVPDYDWSVEMDEGCFDLDAKQCALIPVEEADCPFEMAGEEVAA